MTIVDVITSSRNIAPQIIPKTGRKYATVEVFTAPILSINLTYPIKPKPVEIAPSHIADEIAAAQGTTVGR